MPSCQLYADHFHCFGCGAHGNRVDWLVQAEGLTEAETFELIADWPRLRYASCAPDPEERIRYALARWQEAIPIAGTMAERYLAEMRGIDIGQLPADISQALRFHPSCVFGDRTQPCLLALMRDVTTDAPVGVQRIGLASTAGQVIKIKRMALGQLGAVKLWPATDRLVVGEGLETVLAAATRLSYHGSTLTPAWALISRSKLAIMPVLPTVNKLMVLVDRDLNGEGQAAADWVQERWRNAGRSVRQLIPERPGDDFNDVVLRGVL